MLFLNFEVVFEVKLWLPWEMHTNIDMVESFRQEIMYFYM